MRRSPPGPLESGPQGRGSGSLCLWPVCPGLRRMGPRCVCGQRTGVPTQDPPAPPLCLPGTRVEGKGLSDPVEAAGNSHVPITQLTVSEHPPRRVLGCLRATRGGGTPLPLPFLVTVTSVSWLEKEHTFATENQRPSKARKRHSQQTRQSEENKSSSCPCPTGPVAPRAPDVPPPPFLRPRVHLFTANVFSGKHVVPACAQRETPLPTSREGAYLSVPST